MRSKKPKSLRVLLGSKFYKKQRKQNLLGECDMSKEYRSDLEELLHWMQVTEGSPKEAINQLILSKGESSYESNWMYHYKHNEKAKKASKELMDLLINEFPDGLAYGDQQFVIFEDESIVGAVEIREYATYLTITPTGTEEAIEKVNKLIVGTGRTKKQPIVTRIYKGQYGFDGLDLTLPSVSAPKDSHAFYPYIEETPEEMWEKFNASNANVILFIGPPGVGKTNYIRQMLDARGYDDAVHLVDNETLLMDPELMGYIQSEAEISLLVTEDADRFVAKRENENVSMVGLLNASSGLAGGRVKFVISTNLPHLKSVDEALIRPGRCFKVVEFGKLSPKQAQAARESAGLTFKEFSGNVTLAEALNDENKAAKLMQGIGFN